MTINALSISYPDFKLNDTIDPEQFDINNLEIIQKINEIKEVVNGLIDISLNNGENISIKYQRFEATEGQTLFTLTNGSYLVGKNRLIVYVGGAVQVPTFNFTETSDTSFTLSDGVPAGTIVDAMFFEGNLIVARATHGDSHLKNGIDELDVLLLKNGSMVQSNTDQIGNLSGLQINLTDYLEFDGTDESAAFQTVINGMVDNDVLILPRGKTVVIQSTVVFNGKNNIRFVCDGIIRAKNCSGVQIVGCNFSEFQSMSVYFDGTLNWTLDLAGVEVRDSSNIKMWIKRIIGFNKNLYLHGLTGGVSYCSFYINDLRNGKYGLFIRSEGTGWITENEFYGGRFALDTGVKSTSSGDYAVWMEQLGSFGINNIRMYSPCFEGLHNGLHLWVNNFQLLTPRFEGVDANWIEGYVSYSLLVFGYGDFDTSKFNLDDQSRYNTINGKNKLNDSNLNLMAEHGGVGFVNEADFAQNSFLGYYKNLSAIKETQISGQFQVFNKQFEGTGVPTIGTYRKGAVVWNSSPATGQPMGWMCSVAGTAGTLSGVTLSGASGQKTVTVNTTTGLYPGCWLSLQAGNYTYYVVSIKGNVVTLQNNLAITFTNEPVSYLAPTFKAMPNLP